MVKANLGQATADELNQENGVIQDDSISAFLYILFVSLLRFRLGEVPQSETGVTVNNLEFIDSFVSMKASEAAMQKLLYVTAISAASLGIVLNTFKIKYIVDNRKHLFQINSNDICTRRSRQLSLPECTFC